MLHARQLLEKLALNYERRYPSHDPIVIHVRLTYDDTLLSVDLAQPGTLRFGRAHIRTPSMPGQQMKRHCRSCIGEISRRERHLPWRRSPMGLR